MVMVSERNHVKVFIALEKLKETIDVFFDTKAPELWIRA